MRLQFKNKITVNELFLFFLYGCSMGSFFMFCFKYPNACSQDFRYINLTLFINMIFLGVLEWRSKDERTYGSDRREGKKGFQKML